MGPLGALSAATQLSLTSLVTGYGGSLGTVPTAKQLNVALSIYAACENGASATLSNLYLDLTCF